MQDLPTHQGVHPGEILDAFDFLKREGGPSLSIDAINKTAAQAWAGRR